MPQLPIHMSAGRRPVGRRTPSSGAPSSSSHKQEAWLFNLTMQSGGLGSAGKERAQAVVPFDPIAPTGAALRVVTETVRNATAGGTSSILIGHGQPQTQAEQDIEQWSLDVKPKGLTGRRLEPRSRMAAAGGASALRSFPGLVLGHPAVAK